MSTQGAFYAGLPRKRSGAGALITALAETVNGMFKTELIRRHGPWRTIESVELATLGWVDWWNHRRLHGACNDVPPAEFETSTTLSSRQCRSRESKPQSLYQTQGDSSSAGAPGG